MHFNNSDEQTMPSKQSYPIPQTLLSIFFCLKKEEEASLKILWFGEKSDLEVAYIVQHTHYTIYLDDFLLKLWKPEARYNVYRL